MAIFFIDYENVNHSGFTGLNKLTKEDSIIIFYSDNSNSIPFSLHMEILSTEVAIEYIKITANGKNCLDFQLATYLGSFIGKNPYESYVIVSKDMGFNAVIDFWKTLDVDVKLCENLDIQNQPQIYTQQIVLVENNIEERIKDVTYNFLNEQSEIINIVTQHKNKRYIHNALRMTFGDVKGLEIYKKIKGILPA